MKYLFPGRGAEAAKESYLITNLSSAEGPEFYPFSPHLIEVRTGDIYLWLKRVERVRARLGPQNFDPPHLLTILTSKAYFFSEGSGR